MVATVRVYTGPAIAGYGFPEDHPFGPARHDAFVAEFERRGLNARVEHGDPVAAGEDELLLFHTPEYIRRVRMQCRDGIGFLDHGDTPAFPGCFESGSAVVGTSLAAARAILAGETRRAFIPIAGLHHARRDAAAGFCVFNDCGVVIEWLLGEGGLQRVAYVDIDAHHGDGVFYAFESDPRVIFADLHEDGRYLYPGTGAVTETGRDAGEGFKLNVPMPPYADQTVFEKVWPTVLQFVERHQPEFIILQCGADSVVNDPLTHMAFPAEVHGRAARDLAALADRICTGRLLACGGGGYDLSNIAAAWNNVVDTLAGS
ncbi:MAG: acetoin utilization protein AcuC [Chromatiales bacterium]|nr:acetoin utilization protein AcuC [Chromatiales bacterium]